MLDFYGEFVYNRSPRAVVDRLLFDPEDIYDESLWYCLTCQKCTAFCPSGIDIQGFMAGLRELLLQHGHNKHALFCLKCGSYIMPKKEFEYLTKGSEGEKLRDLLSICERCKQSDYLDILYRAADWPKRIKGK
jgi:Fe-S oxidoreductase